MPLPQRRIYVTVDGELAEVLARTVPNGRSAGQVVHDLALRGAEALRIETEAQAVLLRISEGDDDRFDLGVTAELYSKR